MARKSVFIERTPKETELDDVVAAIKEAQGLSYPPKLDRPMNLRAFLSQSDFNEFKSMCAKHGEKGVPMSVMLGNLIRDYIAKK